jgi:hypothetical protein
VVLRVPKQDGQPIRRERIEATLPGELVEIEPDQIMPF